MAMLKVENLSIKYGSIEAVKNVSFEVNEGEVVTLIGANGAGKTSILRTISGLVRRLKERFLTLEMKFTKHLLERLLQKVWLKCLKDVTSLQD